MLSQGVKRDATFFRRAVEKVTETADVLKADYDNLKNQILKANANTDGALKFSNNYAAIYHYYKHKDEFEIGLPVKKYFQLARDLFSNSVPAKKILS